VKSSIARFAELHGSLQDHRPGVDAAVDEVDRDAEHLDAIGDRLLDRRQPGEGGEQRRVDVDDARRET
jgi:hypothetical protein